MFLAESRLAVQNCHIFEHHLTMNTEMKRGGSRAIGVNQEVRKLKKERKSYIKLLLKYIERRFIVLANIIIFYGIAK